MKRIVLLTVLSFVTFFSVQAQNVGINILTPDSSAILHLESTTQGFLPPRMTTTERDAIPSPAEGLTIFNTVDSTLQYWSGACWLSVFQQSCDDCFFSFNSSSNADTIDRVVTDSVTFTFNIQQNTGNPQNIAAAVVGQLPNGVTVDIDPNPLFSSGTMDITIYATTFAPDGTFPIVFQLLCGSTTYNFIYSLHITPCYYVDLNNTTTNYDLATDFYNTYPSAPTSSPVCVVSEVQAGVDVTSNNSQPAYTTGSLPSGSVLAIINNGNIIGKGGDGGQLTDPIAGTTGEGEDGGTAINLTVDADVVNNFNIYGGGGGGAAAAFGFQFNLGFGLPPLVFVIGSGGGGGAGGGQGGQLTSSIGLSFYSDGTNGTAGQFGVPGQGGTLTAPINFALGPVDVDIVPGVYGGDGGDYGYPGTSGSFSVLLNVSAVINIPFVGPITIPIISNLNLPIPVPLPGGGDGGYAIKRNGNNCSVPDNLYNTSFLRGRVGN